MVESLATDTEAPVQRLPELAGRAAFLDGLGNDASLARRLVDLFLKESVRMLDDVKRAIEEADTERLRRSAHTLKGAVSNFPAGAAREAAARMEAIGFNGDLAAAREQFPELEQEVNRLRGLLPTLL
jgi:HPt (histidine-containing phosphotransfer) domain-containing protein